MHGCIQKGGIVVGSHASSAGAAIKCVKLQSLPYETSFVGLTLPHPFMARSDRPKNHAKNRQNLR
jgi:hypothetical protein